ncbi:hemicentin-2-like [Zonotrichia leucophrys gambelii]|uniref:hemicentin-2-like n=1 Tax=Zonotrichia leucophrys gambelii TaxID=257770 RepID=UPI00314059A2
MARPSSVPLLDSPLPAPSISVAPPRPHFLVGDHVSVTCSAPPGPARVRAFRFWGASGWASEARTTRRAHTINVTVSGPRDGGVHACAYSARRRDGSEAVSEPSAGVLIRVQDRPAQPNLTVSPSRRTVIGQPLLFLCAAPPGPAPPRRHFRFLRDDRELDGDGEPEGSGSARMRVERSGRNDTGNFSCRYEEMAEGRWVGSYASEAVAVVVEEPSPPPVLWVEPRSGVVGAGQRLRLICSAHRRHFRRRFRFFRDGAELRDDLIADVTGDVIEDGSQVVLERILPEFSGNFSCRLEEEVGGAWVEAPPSEGVAVLVVADFDFLPLVIGGVVGVASLLLAILLAAWLCRRRRGGSRWRGLNPGDDTGTLRMGDLEVAA